MPTATRTRRSSRPTSIRAAGVSRRRAAVPQRRGVAGGWLQRRQPQKQSALKRGVSGLGAALPRKAKHASASSSKGRRRGGIVGGLAVLAGAAGLALKNRDKVTSMARRDHGSGNSAAPQP